METLNFLWQGFDVATRPMNLLVALFGAFVGTIVGLLPGLGPINGVALLLPEVKPVTSKPSTRTWFAFLMVIRPWRPEGVTPLPPFSTTPGSALIVMGALAVPDLFATSTFCV